MCRHLAGLKTTDVCSWVCSVRSGVAGPGHLTPNLRSLLRGRDSSAFYKRKFNSRGFGQKYSMLTIPDSLLAILWQQHCGKGKGTSG